jgi:hypothetical protein
MVTFAWFALAVSAGQLAGLTRQDKRTSQIAWRQSALTFEENSSLLT